MQENSAITGISTETPVAPDLGMSALKKALADEVILSNGQCVKLTGTEEDILLVTEDRNMRVKQALTHIYLSGRNLKVARDVFTQQYGTAKVFWDTLTKLTGFSRTKLEGEIRIAEGYSEQEIARLMEAGCNQSLALKMLKSPSVKAQALEEASEGKQITPDVVAEFSSSEVEEAFTPEETAQAETYTNVVSESGHNGHNNVPLSRTNTTTTVTFEPTDNTDRDAAYLDLFIRVNKSRDAYDLSTVRGESVRRELAIIIAAFYKVEIPDLEPQDNESVQIQELRKLAGSKGKLNALQVMSFLDGKIDKMNGVVEMPNYQSLLTSKRVKTAETVETLERIWRYAYNLGEQA